MLAIKDFIKKYDGHPVLNIPALVIAPGIYWVKGPNGSGKTSFFKSISGIIPCTGSVSIKDVNLHKSPTEYRRLINYSEAEPVLPLFLTGTELIAFYAESKGATPAEVEELIEYFGIKSYIPNAIGTYSSGMVKKLSVLLAFIGPAKVILLDEPLITIEDTFLPLIYSLITKLHREKAITFLLSSHQPLGQGIGQYKTLQVANQTITCLP